MFFVLEARLCEWWIVFILWPDQPWVKELADFVSIVLYAFLVNSDWACCNNAFLFQTGEVEMERNEPDWSCRSACSLFHSRYSWSQFYFLLVKIKKSLQSHVHRLHKERQICYSLISWISARFSERGLLDEAGKTNTLFKGWDAEMGSNCLSKQLF